MSNPPETNLTQKFAALQNLISSNHTALMTEITAIKNALTNASGNIDAAPIVSAIQALAGPYPGRTLTDLYDVSSGITTKIGPLPDFSSTSILGILYKLDYALSFADPATNATLLAKVDAIMRSLTLPASLDYTVLQELDLIRQGQDTGLGNLLGAVDPMAVEPPGLCSNAYSSYNMLYTLGLSIEGFGLETQTIATWGGDAPAGLTIKHYLLGDYGIQATDWSLWKIFVQTTAPNFGVKGLTTQRITANTWITLSSDDELNFYVDGQNAIKVYLCRIGEDPAYILTSYTDTFLGNGSRYHAIISNFEMGNKIANTTHYDNVVHIGNGQGLIFKKISGQVDVKLAWIGVNSNNAFSTTLSLDVPYTLGVETTKFIIFSSNVFEISVE